MKWSDLPPEPGILKALDHAGKRPDSGQNAKRSWSERFANACAIAVADQFRGFRELKGRRVLPESLAGGTEPLTPLGTGTSKRIDVTVVDPVLGLEIGASLKGLNFQDGSSGNYDKNLTGRLYELADEVRLVHEHLPHAFMAGILFLPLESASDKTERANSSFANAVIKLRERTGRLDPALPAHASRCDIGFVALYALRSSDGISRGATLFWDVRNNPPRRGRPKLHEGLSLQQMVSKIVAAATVTSERVWAEPEGD